ncbi:hypothetical protein SNE26_09300 [Mucilaginibacter sp. cycad4]|uniref:hypothetical protein n=1 Tax=Mucilaginibacter sp. cycad4 TaxID=3342096 RepID=UPI002AAC1554|nr:hypothetical protein [Mucilaginibacter gossypii]WPV01969.1 hypothetical protein SNE26_09300 [Mucilaginibacter gossypii]
MKKLSMPLAMFAFLLFFFVNKSEAQTADAAKVVPATESYFIGKWKSMFKGVPQGDTEVTIVFEKKEGKISGSMIDPKTNAITNFDAVEVKDGILSTKFTAQGYEVSLSLKKKDDDNLEGSMMEQFDVTGTRIK